jgi:two-component system response regulator FixJ
MKTPCDVVAGTVFVVEDDVGVRDSLLALLHAAGWRTMAFGTGDDVLKCSDTLNEGCLLLDICLPDHDGFEVLMSLRRAGVGLPVIFMTGEERRAEQARAAGIGAFAVLQKPLIETHLLSAITRAFGAGAAGNA